MLFPAICIRGFPGKRLDPQRAGMTIRLLKEAVV